MPTMTPDDLDRLGFTVKDGKAVRVAKAIATTGDATYTAIGEPDATWQQVQKDCYKVFKDAGCAVWWLSQVRRSQQTAGLPDLLIFGPSGHPFMAWWDSKAGRGALSEAQRRFAAHCQRAGVPFGSGGSRAAKQFLKLLLTTTEAGAP